MAVVGIARHLVFISALRTAAPTTATATATAAVTGPAARLSGNAGYRAQINKLTA